MRYLVSLSSGLNRWAIRPRWGGTETFGCENVGVLAVLSELETLAPVIEVQGNVERDDVVMALPIKREIRVGFCRIGIVHILGERKYYARNAQREFPQARVVVFGHSHIPYSQ